MKRFVFGLSIIGSCTAMSIATGALAAPRTHDGTYVQITSGLGYLTTSYSDVGRDLSVSGMTLSTSLLLGTTVMPGMALGGGVLADYSFSPTTKQDGAEVANSPISAQYLYTLGPFVDYYPNPTGGLHFQGMFGLARLVSSYNIGVPETDPTGVMFLAGGGYDWWFADEWSAGVLGRLIVAPMWYQGTSHLSFAPAVAATITYH